MEHRQIMQYMEQFSALTVVSLDKELVLMAIERSHESRIGYYDALIVEAALRADADILYTEDMQHGMRYGRMRIHNPFQGVSRAELPANLRICKVHL